MQPTRLHVASVSSAWEQESQLPASPHAWLFLCTTHPPQPLAVAFKGPFGIQKKQGQGTSEAVRLSCPTCLCFSSTILCLLEKSCVVWRGGANAHDDACHLLFLAVWLGVCRSSKVGPQLTSGNVLVGCAASFAGAEKTTCVCCVCTDNTGNTEVVTEQCHNTRSVFHD